MTLFLRGFLEKIWCGDGIVVRGDECLLNSTTVRSVRRRAA